MPGSRQETQKLRRSLSLSQKESFASSLMTGSFDQFVNAFAIFLGATAAQIGCLRVFLLQVSLFKSIDPLRSSLFYRQY